MIQFCIIDTIIELIKSGKALPLIMVLSPTWYATGHFMTVLIGKKSNEFYFLYV